MQLFDAVISGDLDGAAAVLTRHPKVITERDLNGRQPLHLAAMHGHQPIVRLLLDAKAKVNVKDSSGLTATAYAALFGHSAIFDLLRSLGGDPATASRAGGTALHRAAGEGNVNAVRLLLEAGANPNAQGKSGPTPLGVAVQPPSEWYDERLDQYRMITTMLLDAGAGLEEMDEFGMTPLLRACHQGNAELAEVLLERGADTESRGETDSTALLAAVAAARLATVRTLLKHGADPSARDGDERDALQAAEWHRHRFIGELLARHTGIKIRPLSGKASGAELAMAIQFDDLADARQMLDAEPELLMKPSSFGVKSATPLDVAAYFGRVSAAAMLLELGADPESSGDEFGTHPLHTAAKRGRAGVATLLIRAAADVNVRDRTEKRTPLHHAASMAAVDVVRVLLEAGADRRLKDEKGQTPLQVARARYLTSNPQGWEDPAELRRLNAGYAEVASLLTART